MGVQGFPTLKIVTPSKKPGKPRVEDYQGARSAKAIVDAVVDRIPNHVKRATDNDLDKWLGENEERPKAILFTEKGTTSALIRALAIDFLGAVDVAQVRNKETASVEKFGVSEFPALVVIPGAGKEHQLYQGELKKQPMTEFLGQFATPNPDASGQPAPSASKPKSKSKSSKPASKPTPAPDGDSVADAEKSSETKPVQVPVSIPPIPSLATPESLESSCLAPKSGTCVLVLLPETSGADSTLPSPASDALGSLAEIAHKHAQRGTHLFPIYAIPEINSGSATLRNALGLEDKQAVEVIAVNARRGWWRRYDGAKGHALNEVQGWVDSIRLGEGTKEKLPEGLVGEPEKAEKAKEEVEHDEL